MKVNPNKRVLWRPHPGPQTIFFSCPAEMILLGGAAGGGKSDCLLMACARDVDKEGYKALLLRRTFPELERETILRSRQLFDGIGEYDSRNHRWRFKTPVSPGARVSVGGEAILEFGFMEQEADIYKYSGAQYARIAFDESCFHSEGMIRGMLTRLRSPVPDVRRQILLASNPIGPGFGWHKRIFVEGCLPRKIYGDAMWPSDGRAIGLTTCFIPATVWDNPTLLERDPTYIERLRSQRGDVARALLEGSWDETIYLALDFNKFTHTIPAFPVPPYFSRVIGIDWGKRDKAVAVWLAKDTRFIYAYRDYATKGKDIRPFAYEIINRCRQPDGSLEPIDFIVLSHECFSDRGMGQSQADQFREVFDQFGYTLTPSDRDPEGRLTLIREWLRTTNVPREGVPNVNDYNFWCARMETARREAIKHQEDPWEAENKVKMEMAAQPYGGTYEEDELPKLKVFQAAEDGKLGCPELIQTLPLLVTSIEEPKVLADGQDDHAYDALGHGLRGLISWGNAPGKDAQAYYRELTGGKVPDSAMAAEFAMQAAEQMAGEEVEPIRWRVERWDPWKNYRED